MYVLNLYLFEALICLYCCMQFFAFENSIRFICIFNDKPNIYSIRIIIHTWNARKERKIPNVNNTIWNEAECCIAWCNTLIHQAFVKHDIFQAFVYLCHGYLKTFKLIYLEMDVPKHETENRVSWFFVLFWRCMGYFWDKWTIFCENAHEQQQKLVARAN